MWTTWMDSFIAYHISLYNIYKFKEIKKEKSETIIFVWIWSIGSAEDVDDVASIKINHHPRRWSVFHFHWDLSIFGIESRLLWACKVGEIQWFGISWPPAPVGQGLCGFNEGWSIDVKSRVKSLATAFVTEFDRWNVGSENQYFRSNIGTQGVAKLLTRDLTSMDHPILKPHSPWLASVAQEILKII